MIKILFFVGIESIDWLIFAQNLKQEIKRI